MIGYTTIGASDMGRALAFYDAFLAELGGKRVMETGNGQLYGFAQGPLFGVTKPFDGKVQNCGNGNMIALRCPSKEKVDEMHAKALSLGGTLASTGETLRPESGARCGRIAALRSTPG